MKGNLHKVSPTLTLLVRKLRHYARTVLGATMAGRTVVPQGGGHLRFAVYDKTTKSGQRLVTISNKAMETAWASRAVATHKKRMGSLTKGAPDRLNLRRMNENDRAFLARMRRVASGR